jgi:hypothetical protein
MWAWPLRRVARPAPEAVLAISSRAASASYPNGAGSVIVLEGCATVSAVGDGGVHAHFELRGREPAEIAILHDCTSRAGWALVRPYETRPVTLRGPSCVELDVAGALRARVVARSGRTVEIVVPAEQAGGGDLGALERRRLALVVAARRARCFVDRLVRRRAPER